MAEESRPPPEERPALPRRIPGAGLTPRQVWRNFPPTPESAAQAPPSAEPADAERSEPTSPAALASSAASLVQATSAAEMAAEAAAQLAAAAAPRRTPGALWQPPVAQPTPSQSAMSASEVPAAPVALAPRVAQGIDPAGPAKSTGPTRSTGRRQPASSPRQWQLAGLVIAVVLMIGAVAALVASHHAPKLARQHSHAASAPAVSQRLANALAIRSQAVGWVATQVGRDVTVTCDAATCSALAARGFPASNLTVVQPTASDPYGAVLVIATADIRSQFGRKLDVVYAPQVIASFGAGPSRIDVRVIAPLGPVAFSTALSADLAARKSSGAQLLRNPRIAVSAGTRALLADGLIDSRLLTTIAFLAAKDPIDIVGFGGASPGAAPVPLRSVYLAESDPAAHVAGNGYVQSLEALLHSQSPPYVPLSVGSVQLGGGPQVLEVEFAAPSPLGLLRS